MTEREREKLIEAMTRALMNVSTPSMNGDNLAILLCSFFDDGGPDVDEHGWSQAALAGFEEVKAAMTAAALSAVEAAIRADAMAWRPIETAPFGDVVLLGWWSEDGMGGANWETEVGAAAWGWRRGTISNRSMHGHATHWLPLPTPPAIG